jgi:hypothetical protein
VLAVGVALFASLWTDPTGGAMFRPGVVLGAVAAGVLLGLQWLLGSLWIWAPASWFANAPGMASPLVLPVRWSAA